ncbi:MAG TPA: hypothetical protein VNM92_03925 [Thermoanaerobaculia bacterium]|nr:hypothetical protein [Thermoanaerobaculia bacterium]
MRCTAEGQIIECAISSVRIDGRRLNGSFRARYDGKLYASSGIPGVDQVALTRVNNGIVDAMFLYKGRRVFGYRSVQSQDRKSLTIASVDPETRQILTSVIVYERRGKIP